MTEDIKPTYEELLEHNQELREQLAEFLDPANAKLYRIDENGETVFSSLTFRILSFVLGQVLTESKAPNVVEYQVHHPVSGYILHTIQRVEGLTLMDIKKLAEQERDQWKRLYAGLLESHKRFRGEVNVKTEAALEALAFYADAGTYETPDDGTGFDDPDQVDESHLIFETEPGAQARAALEVVNTPWGHLLEEAA